MNAIHKIPEPIINEHRLRNRDGSHVTVSAPFRGDHFNLTTGECTVARVIGGVRYDTVRATLIASAGAVDEHTGDYRLQRLYRASHGAYFVMSMEWSDELGFNLSDFIKPIPEDGVLSVARLIVPPSDCMQFLHDWYCMGWIPRNDIEAQGWAEFTLSADDCEAILVEFAGSTRRA